VHSPVWPDWAKISPSGKYIIIKSYLNRKYSFEPFWNGAWSLIRNKQNNCSLWECCHVTVRPLHVQGDASHPGWRWWTRKE
jgi:hypothetical protein